MEEPYPGWLRVEVEGQKPFYKSPFPRTVLRSAAMLRDFLEKENAAGRMLNVQSSQFSFKRKLGIKAKNSNLADAALNTLDQESTSAGCQSEPRSTVELLTRDPNKLIEHPKLLSNVAKKVDASRLNDAYKKPQNFDDLRERLAGANDLRDIITFMSVDQSEALTASFSDICLKEVSLISTKCGPLVEFPASVNENVYCKIVEFALHSCPQLISFVINLVVRKGEPVLPSDVLKIATLFSTLCHAANHDIDALVKLRSLTMQVDGLSNLGIDILSDCGLSQCARSLSNHRDLFAEVGRSVMDNTATSYPFQSILDNCDIQEEHLTVEVIEKETVDTSNLSTASKTKEEALSLFSMEQILLGSEQNKEELKHFKYVVALAAGKVLASKRPDAKKLAAHLPAHHIHKNSKKKLTPAITFIKKPYPYNETKNPDMIKLLVRIQRQFLQSVAKTRENEPDFLLKLKLLEDPGAETEEREKAEKEVRKAVLDYGEWIGAGDLLTVKMIQEARMMMAGSVTAFGRLEFLGPFRLQLLHMKMKKICQDFAVCMKNENNYDDKISLPWLTSLTNMKITNKTKEIKKNDSSFERHDQSIAAVQTSYLVNMFDNFMVKHSELLDDVTDTNSAVRFILDMFEDFNLSLFYDPSRPVVEKMTGEDDMFVYCQDMVTRFLLSLVFDTCEEEEDAEGLRALRRVMVSYFLAKSTKQDSKYASFTLIDLVVELVSSERTRKRMDLYVVINPSGTAAGGLFRDKFEEHCIRTVKTCLRNNHGGIDDIKMEKDIGGLSVLTGIVQHNRSAVLRSKEGKQHSKDMVGDKVRELLDENVQKYDPFNRNRKEKFKFVDKPKGGPYHGLTESDLERFIVRKKREYNTKYK